jgi:hypothetical protein
MITTFDEMFQALVANSDSVTKVRSLLASNDDLHVTESYRSRFSSKEATVADLWA